MSGQRLSQPPTRTPTALARLTAKAKRTKAQDDLAFQLKAAKITHFTEHEWHPERKFRADAVAWNPVRIAVVSPLIVEVDGGLYVNGGHTRGAARERDYERDAEAMLLGFRVLRVSPRHVKQGKAIQWIQELLK